MKPEDEALCGGARGGGKNVVFYEFIKRALLSTPLGMDAAGRLKVEEILEGAKQKHLSLVDQNGQSP